MALRFCPRMHAVQTQWDDHGDKHECPVCHVQLTRYTAENVCREPHPNGSAYETGYFYAPCEVCGLPINVGNYPPVIESLNHFGVRCLHHATER